MAVTMLSIEDREPRIELNAVCYTAQNFIPYIKFSKFLGKILASFPLSVFSIIYMNLLSLKVIVLYGKLKDDYFPLKY